MAENEADVIGHLFDVEHEAAGMMVDAQTEADKRIAAAKAVAEADYKKRYGVITSDLDVSYKNETDRIQKEKNDSFVEYKDGLEKSVKDIRAFNKLLDSVLFAG